MGYLLVGIAVLAVVFGPALWARGILAWHGDDRPDFPGSGGELARHLLDESGLEAVKVEATCWTSPGSRPSRSRRRTRAITTIPAPRPCA
jgi:hypothetical protein